MNKPLNGVRVRSPIEQMVDRACGLKPGEDPQTPKPSQDDVAIALATVGDAAKGFVLARRRGMGIADARGVLLNATERLMDLGW